MPAAAARRITPAQLDRALSDYWRIASAAKECGLAVSTVDRAISHDWIPCVTIGDGTRLVRLADVQHFRDNRPPRGRPPLEE